MQAVVRDSESDHQRSRWALVTLAVVTVAAGFLGSLTAGKTPPQATPSSAGTVQFGAPPSQVVSGPTTVGPSLHGLHMVWIFFKGRWIDTPP